MAMTQPEPVLASSAPAVRQRGSESEDQILTIHNVSWDEYVALTKVLGDRGGVRVTYLEGTLELMNPGTPHEWVKGALRRLVEAHAEEMGIDISSYGSATFRKKVKKRGIEPDECYFLVEGQKFPDLAIEIIFSRSRIDKLSVYAGLGVPEVWFWKDGHILVHWLGDDGYTQEKHSKLLPGIDIAELEELLRFGTQSAAVREYRARLRRRQRARR